MNSVPINVNLARRASGLAAPHPPGPEQPKAGTMPSYDRFWFEHGQCRAPVTSQTDPQQAVPRGQFPAFSCGPPKYTNLVAQRQVLGLEAGTWTADRGQNCEECRERNEHQRRIMQESIILIGSDSSRFSRGTVLLLELVLCPLQKFASAIDR